MAFFASTTCNSKKVDIVLHIVIAAMVAACAAGVLARLGLMPASGTTCPAVDHYSMCEAARDLRRCASLFAGPIAAAFALRSMDASESDAGRHGLQACYL